MPEILSFFVVILASLIFSELFVRFHLPWVVALIIGGMIIGPFGLDIFTPSDTLSFLGEIGLIFLMFMAGLQTRLSGISNFKSGTAVLAILNGGLPFLAGFGIGLYFGYSITASLLIGIIFISSSVAVIIPSLQTYKFLRTRVGKSILTSTVFEDIASLLLLSILLQKSAPLTSLPLPVFYVTLLVVLVALRWFITKIRKFFAAEAKSGRDLFQLEVRSILGILVGTVIAFQLLGLHSIIAGFFAGLVLSGTITSEELFNKLSVISYGIFIPIFFVVLGANTNIGVFGEISGLWVFTIVIILGSMLSKFIGGVIAGKLNGFSAREGALIGAATIPQLSTTLAVGFSSVEANILGNEFIAVLVALSITTTFLSPIFIKYIAGKNAEKIQSIEASVNAKG